MLIPTLDDTIVAVSTGWSPSPLAIVRMSGPESIRLVTLLACVEPADARLIDVMIELQPGLQVPATAFTFRAPRSYTGQDLVELHVPGCLPLVALLAEKLIELGARRAQPGEFTARAFLNGKLDAAGVERVSALLHGADITAAARELRAAGDRRRARIEALRDGILDLLARLEAGIDFVDEEDVRFIERDELGERLGELTREVEALRAISQPPAARARPHVALAGLPNAGKSTLFNALVGSERVIVSPVAGSTRDVVAADIEIDGLEIVLQDCAGLGAGVDDLELAAHRAGERAREWSDLVLWVHAADSAWTTEEVEAASRIAPSKRILVVSKSDLAPSGPVSGLCGFQDAVSVAGVSGAGVADLRKLLAQRLTVETGGDFQHELNAARSALAAAQASVGAGLGDELIAEELRAAYSHLDAALGAELAENVLATIFGEFCIGK